MPQAVVVTGISAIDRKLKRLAPAVQKKIARQAMRAGIKLVAAEVRSQVPVDTGLLRSAVKVRAVKGRKRGSIEIEVVIDSKIEGLVKRPSSGAKPAFYPAIVEFGDRNTPPNPFARRAYESKGEAAKQVTMDRLLSGTLAEIAK